jgi:hypothetical protein
VRLRLKPDPPLRKAVCPNLFAALPNVFFFKILPFLLHFADSLFGVKLQYLRAKTIKKNMVLK